MQGKQRQRSIQPRAVVNAEIPTIRILVVDDHPLIRSLICRLLEAESDFKIAGEATTGAEAIVKTKELQPDVIVIDIGLPDIDGLQVTNVIAGLAPCSKVIVMSAFCGDPTRDAFRAGASGYVLKSDCARDLAIAVRTVNSSEPFRRRRHAWVAPQ
jgi:DNA-binding NarL/FixJ family response regulator